MSRTHGIWIGLDAENEVDEVSIALGRDLQPVPMTPAVQQAADSAALAALRLSGGGLR